MTIFNLLLLVLVLVFSTESMAVFSKKKKESMAAPGGGSSPTVSYEYDELQLVLQWPTSFCNTHYCDYNQIPDYFTVHGLWFNKNSCPVICPRSNSNIGLYPQTSGLQEDMKTYWPDLRSQKYPENFWLYEYAKHGSCLPEFQFQNQVYYFRTAIELAKGIRTMSLRSGDLKIGQPYQVNDFHTITTASGTFFPSLRCNYANGITQLLEIVFCTDRNRNPKSCTSKDTMACSGWFQLPQVPLPAFLPRFPPGPDEEPEFLPCPSRFPPQVPASLPSSSRFPPGMRTSATSRALPLMQFTYFLSQIFLHFLLFNYNFLTSF